MKTRQDATREECVLSYGIEILLSVLEEFLNGFVRNHLLIEDVSTGLGALHHLDDF